MATTTGYARYTGEWLRQQQYEDPERFTVETPPDPAHGDMDVETYPVVMYKAPVLQESGEIEGDALWENYDVIPPPQRIDETPVDGQGTPTDRGHGYGGSYEFQPAQIPENYGTADYGRGYLGGVRGRDLGAAKDLTSQPPKYQFYDEQWFGLVTSGLGPPPITGGAGDRVLRRGLNAYPENDGDGGRTRDGGVNVGSSWRVNTPSWKRGDYFQSNINRDFTPPHRQHGQVHWAPPDIVTIIGDAPPPDVPDKYASPFSSLQKFMPKARRIRGMRRQPGPWDEDIIASAPPVAETMTADGTVAN